MMRTIEFLLVLATLLVLVACDESPDTYELNREFEIQEDQIVTMPLHDEDDAYLSFQVLDIAESRCPSNASCVRYGEAEVMLAANGLDEVVHTLELCIGDCPQRGQERVETDTANVTLDGVDYRVVLLAVNPYPTITNGNLPKSARLKVLTE